MRCDAMRCDAAHGPDRTGLWLFDHRRRLLTAGGITVRTETERMGWIETTNDAQVSFSDENMDETVVWSENRTANVSAELEEYLTERYDEISSVGDDSGSGSGSDPDPDPEDVDDD